MICFYCTFQPHSFIETFETLQGLALVSWYRSVAPPATHATQLATGGVACDGRVVVCLLVLCERNSDAEIGGERNFCFSCPLKIKCGYFVCCLMSRCLISYVSSRVGQHPPIPHLMNVYCISLGQSFGFAWLLFGML